MALAPRGFLVKSPTCDGPPKYSLLSSVSPISITDPNWAASGIEWEDFLCGEGLEAFIDECSPVTGFTKPAERNTQFCAADPFVVVGSYECPPVGRPGGEAFEIARKRLLVWESHQVEETLWTGSIANGGGTLNPSFAFGNDECGILPVNLTPAGGPVDIVASLALLESALGDEVACGGTIHVPARVLDFMARFNLLTIDNGKLYTPLGNLVVAGHGYPGTGPANVAPTGPTNSWIFATGPIIYTRTNVFTTPDHLSEAVDTKVNNVTVRAERFYSVGFSCALFAIEVDLCDSCV